MTRHDLPPHDKRLIVALHRGGRTHALRLGSRLGVAALCTSVCLATWFVVATVYLVDHDPLLGALLARQTSMQYAYEDQIAALKSRLDSETSRGATDRQLSGATLEDLTALGTRLEQRAETVERLVAASAGKKTAPSRAFAPEPIARTGGSAADPAPSVISAPVRPADVGATASDRPATIPAVAGSGPRQRLKTLATTFAALANRQSLSVERLREPVLADIGRFREALAQVGVARLATSRNAGGPYVPLASGASATTFDEQAALLEAAIEQRNALGRTVERVPLRRPLDGPLEVTSSFGARLDPFLGRPALHTGVDLQDDAGDRVTATAAGVVTIAGANGGYGNMVEIDHGDGLATRYAHLASIDVAAHQTVAAGTLVGRVGSTGRATGPHLHYETRVDGVPVDPSRFLKASFGLFPAE